MCLSFVALCTHLTGWFSLRPGNDYLYSPKRVTCLNFSEGLLHDVFFALHCINSFIFPHKGPTEILDIVHDLMYDKSSYKGCLTLSAKISVNMPLTKEVNSQLFHRSCSVANSRRLQLHRAAPECEREAGCCKSCCAVEKVKVFSVGFPLDKDK